LNKRTILNGEGMNKELESKIRFNFTQALNQFNFANVYTIMNYLGWTWCEENHSPSQIQMIETVKELFEHAIKSFEGSYSYVSSGGFLVRIYENGRVEIHFIVEESEYSNEE
jgi:hypothetical protein